jgi:hypothetical protein
MARSTNTSFRAPGDNRSAGSERMRSYKLEVFHNTCGQCGHTFDRCVHPVEDGVFVYESSNGELRYFDSLTDRVWNEVKELTDEVLGREVSGTNDVAVFHRILNLTIDPPTDGGTFISSWEKVPCPECASTSRSRFGPYSPPRFEVVNIQSVTHYQWFQLSAAERFARAKGVC